MPSAGQRDQTRPLGKTGLRVPRIVYGVSCLGNLYEALPLATKRGIAAAWFQASDARPVAVDAAGKYGAGLALEVVGDSLREMEIAPEDVLLSNKLGWLRTPLTTDEPTFEPGVWADLRHDAVQRISPDGILECWRQGLALLGAPYRPQLVSVHDPDEYLAAAINDDDRRARRDDVLQAYAALHELKQQGEVAAVGVGAKDWRVIKELSADVDFDWVMLANSLTVFRHPPELLEFVRGLASRGVGIINSAVFNAGFLVGGKFLDYRVATPEDDPEAFAWRDRFSTLCSRHDVAPAVACVQFGLSAPGVAAIALNTSSPSRVLDNARAVDEPVPAAFWQEAKSSGLIDPACDFVG
ncbi:Pyridoxal 4-dehydrogenase [Posidoniimonas polymericola]|uniref:Pyridoxal 4-dehydrogenase n=1 Tax=Posidoniimonas polymericola TaxID=2528002 RepID=A0A5C5YRT6_9BACT|nr:aldo/keto reductase [Posidoniimonas polymericola]TWT77609.1 Pyridoxal 4-dehydrogenase [Posidoniimonas polymericola]